MAETLEALQAEMQVEAEQPQTATAEGAPVEDTGTIADHEAKFQAERNERGQFQPGQPKERHRADSQKASPEDVPKINELTKRLREAEKEIGIEQQEGESQRVFELRRRAEMAERVRDANKAKAAPVSSVVAPPRAVAMPQEFTEPEPKLDDFSDQPDPYSAWQRACGKWDRNKESFESAKTQAVASHSDAIKSHRNAYGQRLAAHYQSNPEAQAAIEAAPHQFIKLPIALEAAIVLHHDAGKVTEAIAKNPALFNELFALSKDQDPTEEFVAYLQRTLSERAQAASSTGAAAPRMSIPPALRLPTPVRTTPQAAPSDGRPKEDDSLSAHEQFHYPEGSRGRFRR